MKCANNHPELRESLMGYSPNVEAAEDAYSDAISKRNNAQAAMLAYSALEPHKDDLDEDGRRVLCGCANMIVQGGWGGSSGLPSRAILTFGEIYNTLSEPAAEDPPTEPEV